jgi:hypothetical protein
LQEQTIIDEGRPGGDAWRQGHGDAGVTDIEEIGRMQKEKPSFEAIPNWRN